MLFHDKVGISGKRKLADGRLVVDARFARAGIYHYDGAEVGKPDMQTVRVYRAPEEVFHEDAMASFSHRAVTDDHPPEMVDSLNWSRFAKGFTGDQVARDGGFVRTPMMIADAALVDKVDSGKADLSAGYDAELTFQVGKTPDGEHYDAVMRNIRGNHIAVVDKGRAGAECRIADSLNEGAIPMADQLALKTFLFDGVPIQVTDAGAAAIEKLQGILRDSAAAIERTAAEHATAIAAKAADLATRDATIADLKAKALTDEQLDAKVAERAAFVASVSKIADGLDIKGKSVADAKRAACDKAAGNGATKDKSDAYVDALFDALVARADKAKEAGAESGAAAPVIAPVRDALADALGEALPGGGGADRAPANGGEAYQKMTARMADAWQDPDKRAAA